MDFDYLVLSLIGLLVVGVIAYVVLRSSAAGRRGEDPVAAAADALRDVGPPALAAGALVVAVAVAVGFVGILLLLVLLEAIFENDESGLTTLVVLIYLTGAVLVLGVVAIFVWTVRRVRYRSR